MGQFSIGNKKFQKLNNLIICLSLTAYEINFLQVIFFNITKK